MYSLHRKRVATTDDGLIIKQIDVLVCWCFFAVSQSDMCLSFYHLCTISDLIGMQYEIILCFKLSQSPRARVVVTRVSLSLNLTSTNLLLILNVVTILGFTIIAVSSKASFHEAKSHHQARNPFSEYVHCITFDSFQPRNGFVFKARCVQQHRL
jgi:hypothetical protein